MLLSLSKKFIFVANVKTASSSIEKALGGRAEFKISQTKFGKHDTLSTISRKFPWVRRYVPYADFFVFGVIRDPVDLLLSLYNSHHKEIFDGLPHSTRGLSFDDFRRQWCAKSWQAKPQHLRFTDEHNRLRVSHLIDYAQLESEFPRICARLGLPDLSLPMANVSPQILGRGELTKTQLEDIQNEFAEDYELIRNRPRQV
jgi:sulfotransferase famil protein